MKKTLIISVLIYLLTGSAWALTIQSGSIDVGTVDNKIAWASLPNSGDKTEINWVTRTLLGKSLIDADEAVTMTKYTTTSSFWTPTDQAYTYAIDFKSFQPEFFFIKIGDGSLGDVSDHYLYQNVSNLDWGVVNLAALGIQEIIGVDRISHIGEINGGAPVPEPATLLLLGSGLLGLAGIRRKASK